MKRLRDWLVFEAIFTVLYAAAFVGCIYASKQLLTNLVWNNPLLTIGQGCLGIITILLGAGFILGIIFIALMAIEINPEVAYEEKMSRNG